MKKVIVHNLKTIPKDAAIYWNNNGSGFAKQLEIRKQIKTFCEQPGIKTAWLSRKRISTSKSLKEFKEFNSQKLNSINLTHRGKHFPNGPVFPFFII